jgi:hypothetical protein
MSDKQINVGRPAFPIPRDGHSHTVFESGYGGMPLRDYFAAKAMAALIAEPVNEGRSSTAWHWTDQLRMHTQMSGPDIIAHAAYMMADAMLKARREVND